MTTVTIDGVVFDLVKRNSEIVDDLKSKTCENCKHSYSSDPLNPTHCKVVTFPYFCEIKAEWEDMPLEINKDFGCNKFERKEDDER